jgi:hypothetical protein
MGCGATLGAATLELVLGGAAEVDASFEQADTDRIAAAARPAAVIAFRLPILISLLLPCRGRIRRPAL